MTTAIKRLEKIPPREMGFYIFQTYNIMKLLYILIIALLFPSTTAYSYDDPPNKFLTKEDALKRGRKVEPLKDKGKQNCIISDFDDHDLKISIYDRNPYGEYEISNHLTITSWYQEAKISYEDLLGEGIKFIRIEFEGNTGTGILQKITSYWGWHTDQFIPIFFETTSYKISGKYVEELKMNYEFKNTGSKQISAVLKYDYTNSNPKYKYRFIWSETLYWQDEGYSFYDLKEEEKKLSEAGNPIFNKIIRSRINQIKGKRNMETIDVELLNEIGIMQILVDDAY